MSVTYTARGWFGVIGCLGFAGAIVVACSSDDSAANPPAADASIEAESGGQTVDATGDSNNDAQGDADPWFAACKAVTPPAPNCSCLCAQCAQVTAECYKDPDCTAIVTCAQQTGCRNTTECLGVCGTVITMHAAGLTAAQSFANCFGPMCSSECTVPKDGSTDGPVDATSEAATEDAPSEASGEASMEDAGDDGSSEAASNDGATTDASSDAAQDAAVEAAADAGAD